MLKEIEMLISKDYTHRATLAKSSNANLFHLMLLSVDTNLYVLCCVCSNPNIDDYIANSILNRVINSKDAKILDQVVACIFVLQTLKDNPSISNTIKAKVTTLIVELSDIAKEVYSAT